MRLALFVVAAALATARPAWAADPQPYTVTIERTGNAPLDDSLTASSQLESLRTTAPASPFALIGRAQEDVERLETVLGSYGYYQGHVLIRIAGESVDDPALPETLVGLPKETVADVHVGVTTGPLYHIRRTIIDGEVPESARAALGISGGMPAIAAEVLAGRDRLLAALLESGYALAIVDAPTADELPAENALDVTFPVHAGRAFLIGEIRIVGLQRVRESLLRRRLLVHAGELYRASQIDRARQDLLKLGVFSSVTVRAAGVPDGDGRMPLIIEVRERPRHALTATAAYSSDLGGSAGATWSDRDLAGGAEQLTLSAKAINLGGSAAEDVGYDAGVQLVKPAFLAPDQSLQFSLRAINQNLVAYDQKAFTFGTMLVHKLSDEWTASAGVVAQRERIIQEQVTRDYTLLSMPISLKYDSTGLANLLADPMHGVRASASVTPTESLGPLDTTFLVMQVSAATYIDAGQLLGGRESRSIVALRALVGAAQGAGQFSLPPDQRFYGGGSTTVRGFRYQSIGPQFPDGNPAGGTGVNAATVEFRQRFGSAFGAAAFVDAGRVTVGPKPLQGSLSVGVGLGLRYYTGVGPIRIDVAMPTHSTSDSGHLEVYVGLGQVF
jgi:translocation and assembly module TamA